MTLSFEDILGAICTQVKLFNENEFQKVFALLDSKEAKLAFEILVTHGFEAKVYHEPNKASKLYITNPILPPQQLQDTLALVMAYAKALKQIKQSLDGLKQSGIAALESSDYTVTVATIHPVGKQIVAQIIPVASSAAPASSPPPSTVNAKQASAQPVAETSRAVKKMLRGKVKGHYDELSAGPAVGKENYPGKLKVDGSADQQSWRKRFFTYMRANIAVSSFAIFSLVLLVFLLYGTFVFTKAWLCPDFASMKRNSAWYCDKPEEETDENKKKLKELQQH